MSARNPSRSESWQTTGHRNDKRTLTILDALNELDYQGLVHDSRDGTALAGDDFEGLSTTDDQAQFKGVEVFTSFQKSVQRLDKELQNLASAVGHLGSSVGILSSSFHLRQRLLQVLSLFRENAADLFPSIGRREQREIHLYEKVMKRIRKNNTRRRKEKVYSTRPVVQGDLTLECLPAELGRLAKDITTFLESLNEFPELSDETINASILTFEGDLKYWASCLTEFEGQFRHSAVERYVHGISGEMGGHIDKIVTAITVLVEVGVPTIRFAQKHATKNLGNLSTVATFFSAVTATTIQFSFDKVQGPLQNAVNGFWFSSLVFSIAAAVNALLGLTWKQAIYHSPRDRVSWWVLMWIQRSPLIFLVVSVAAFSVGLVLFTWSSGQHLATCIVTTVFTAFSSIGLVIVAAWFAFERVTYSRHKGRRWLADVLSDLNTDIRKYTGVAWAEDVLPRHTTRARTWSAAQASRFAQAGTGLMQTTSRVLNSVLPRKNEEGTRVADSTSHHSQDVQRSITRSPISFRFSGPLSVPNDSKVAPLPRDRSSSPAGTVEDINSLSAPRRQASKDDFASNENSTLTAQKATIHNRKLTGFSAIVDTLDNSSVEAVQLGDAAEPLAGAKLQRFIMLSRSLRNMDTTETLHAHQAVVKHLQFSPNGKWLATCSWDLTSTLYKVGSGEEPFMPHRTLTHLEGFVHQVAWAPKGGQLLTRLHRCIKVWTEDGACIKTIVRHKAVRSVTWLPNSREFLSVEGSEVSKVDLSGKTLDSHYIPRLALNSVAVTPDEKLMVGVATLIESPDGLQPLTARKENRIFVYNLEEKTIEDKVPVSHKVQDITISSHGHFALVSYEDRAPPQLWQLIVVNDDCRLSLRHTYMPNMDVEFSGPSYFGGKNDEFILCPGKNAHIYIWDRESAALLRDIDVPDAILTGLAWNCASDTPMFATGSQDGAVKIWRSSFQQQMLDDSCSELVKRSESPVDASNCQPKSEEQN